MNTTSYENSRYEVQVLCGNKWVSVSTPKHLIDAEEILCEYAERGHRARLSHIR